MTAPLVVYFFKLRSDTKPGKWHQSRHRMTIEEAKARHGEGNYEVIEWSKEVREVGPPGSTSAAHVWGPQEGSKP